MIGDVTATVEDRRLNAGTRRALRGQRYVARRGRDVNVPVLLERDLSNAGPAFREMKEVKRQLTAVLGRRSDDPGDLSDLALAAALKHSMLSAIDCFRSPDSGVRSRVKSHILSFIKPRTMV